MAAKASKRVKKRTKLAKAFIRAFNDHKPGTALALMSDQPVWEFPIGPERHGTRYEGAEAVLGAMERNFRDNPDISYDILRTYASADSIILEVLVGSEINRTEEQCVDILTFDDDDRIAVKRAYRKLVRELTPGGRTAADEREETRARQTVVEAALAMSGSGLSPGTSGNVSRRWHDGILITPTGLAYDRIGVEDVVFVDATGGVGEGGRQPSSEWRLHLAAYRARPDAGAVVHCHSPNATALACAHKPIPAFHYMVAAAGGGDIPLAPYATFGTGELAVNVETTLRIRKACLMANHGQIATGATPAEALDLALEVETLAAQYVKVLDLGGPCLLSAAEMARVHRRFETYGQRSK